MKHFIDIFSELATTNSKLDKEAILLANKANTDFKELLKANLNPYRLFQFNKIPEYVGNRMGQLGDDNYNSFIKLIDRLETRTITGNEAKEEVRSFFMNSHIEESGWYEKILLKSAIGVGAKTVNKVYGKDFIPTFEVMLASSELADIVNIRYPKVVQRKYDGFRCIMIPNKDSFDLYSRAGNIFVNKHLKTHFKSLENLTEYVLDGELYDTSSNFNDLCSTLKNEDKPLPATLKYVVYDCMKLDEWKKQQSSTIYEDRLKNVRSLLNNVVADPKRVIDVYSDIADNGGQVKEFYKKALADGYEGVMLKDPQGLYNFKRVTAKSEVMLKLKPFESVDLKVIEIYEGQGALEGTAGGIICDFAGHAVRIGSGLSMEVRQELQENPQAFIGKIAEIKYFEVTEDKSLRFPIWMRWREDKS